MARRPKAIDMELVSASAIRGPSARGLWYWRARAKDQDRRTVWTGWADREDASRTLALLIASGLPSKPDAQAQAGTVGSLLRRWQVWQEDRHEAGQIAASTLASYRLMCGWWCADLEDVLLSRVTRLDFERVILAWGADVSPRSTKHAVKILRLAWGWGIKRGHCEPIDFRRLAPKVKREEYVQCSYTPSPRQVAAVLAKLDDSPAADVVRLLAHTGARVGEATAVDPARDVDHWRRTLRLRGKTGPRDFPLDAEALRMLEAADGWCNRPDLVRDVLNDACAAAKVPRFTPHGLRRYVAMKLLNTTGGNAKAVSKLTGHSVEVLLRDYVRPSESDLRSLVLRAGLGELASEDEKVVSFPGSDE